MTIDKPHTERYKEMSDRHQRAVIATEEKGKIWIKVRYDQGSTGRPTWTVQVGTSSPIQLSCRSQVISFKTFFE